ncbi:phage regulatory CII family protein [Klebsiella aerogenes]|nr:phage regulatory CII family protein [Klebsiella aerogenes]
MFDYRVSKHPHFDEACRAFAQRHNMAKLADRAGMNVQTLRNKLNPEQPHQLTAPEIWMLTYITEDSTLVDGFLAQIHCLPCVPLNEVASEKMPHYVLNATAEIGRVAASAVSGEHQTATERRQVIESINSVTRLMALTAVSLHARLQYNPAMASAVDTVTGLSASFGLI